MNARPLRLLPRVCLFPVLLGLLAVQRGCSLTLATVVSADQEKKDRSSRQPPSVLRGIPPGTRVALAATDHPKTVGRLVGVMPFPGEDSPGAPPDSFVRVRTDWEIRDIPLADVQWVQPNPHRGWRPMFFFLFGACIDVSLFLSYLSAGLSSGLQ